MQANGPPLQVRSGPVRHRDEVSPTAGRRYRAMRERDRRGTEVSRVGEPKSRVSGNRSLACRGTEVSRVGEPKSRVSRPSRCERDSSGTTSGDRPPIVTHRDRSLLARSRSRWAVRKRNTANTALPGAPPRLEGGHERERCPFGPNDVRRVGSLTVCGRSFEPFASGLVDPLTSGSPFPARASTFTAVH